jgi:hypothetical protein
LGYTHHDAISVTGSGGLAGGSAGSESQVIWPSGDKIENIHVNIMPVTTGAANFYTIAPVAGTVSAISSYSVSAGTGRAVTVTVGSAGAILMDTGAVAANGTIGVPVAMTNSSGTTTIASGASMKVAIASCATAQVQVACLITITPTA